MRISYLYLLTHPVSQGKDLFSHFSRDSNAIVRLDNQANASKAHHDLEGLYSLTTGGPIPNYPGH